jgi:hypothetical protein
MAILFSVFFVCTVYESDLTLSCWYPPYQRYIYVSAAGGAALCEEAKGGDDGRQAAVSGQRPNRSRVSVGEWHQLCW